MNFAKMIWPPVCGFAIILGLIVNFKNIFYSFDSMYITYPKKAVFQYDTVKGHSNCTKNNYIFVAPIRTRVTYVMKGPLNLSSKGDFIANAQFGNASNNNDEFKIELVCTKSILPEGALKIINY